jgi:ribosomal protein S18 acetylase RimI-like enzyme
MPEATPPHPTTSTKETTIIRLASTQDASQIASLGASVFSTTFGYSLPPADLTAYLSSAYSTPSITTDILNPSMTTVVASPTASPSTVLGFAQLTRGSSEPCVVNDPSPVELQRLYVSTEAHGLGLGRKLVQEVEKIAKAEGYETLWLGVWEENAKAHGFYGKVGFERCGSHDFVMGETVQRDWILKKSL